MKKTLLLALIILVTFFNMQITSAKTLRELKNELENKEREQRENDNKTKLTNQQITATKSRIINIQKEIARMNDEMVTLAKDINKLEKDIKAKDIEIKKIINYLQISSGENEYLEYLLGAKDFKDFIYRAAVSEQLSKYNSGMIKHFTKMIEDNKQKKIEMEKKEVELKQKQIQLGKDLESLREELNHLTDVSFSIADEIKMQKEVIQLYIDRGCKLDQEITTCGRETLPIGTMFYRPLGSGYVTSEFGPRSFDIHYGTDFSHSKKHDIPVYSIGTGLVISVWHRHACGGNIVFIQHKLLNGKTYTSQYAHLRTINVKKGDQVTKDTVVGIMGGDPAIETFDHCSTGTHAHVQISYGLYMTDYSSWSQLIARSFNLRTVVNIPRGTHNWFYDRISKY